MEIQYIDVDRIIPYEHNPRKSSATIQQVKKSIEEFGFQQCLVLDKLNEIVVGHSRYYAAKELGIKQVPCVIAKDLTPAQIKAYRIADNRISQDGEWDTELLKLEFKELNALNFDFTKTGFTKAELQSLTVDPIQLTKNLTDITEQSQKEKTAEYHEAEPTGGISEDEYVNLNFTLKYGDRKIVFDRLNKIKEQKKLLTSSDALVDLCKE